MQRVVKMAPSVARLLEKRNNLFDDDLVLWSCYLKLYKKDLLIFVGQVKRLELLAETSGRNIYNISKHFQRKLLSL